ncbi:MAG TPA: hypothetical protein VLK25_01930 [Allosphingosinicella sp.]|nr:hypothetical protein [Allosphingosinicella sp.]
MTYEARHSTPINIALAIACALLSILGFAVAGVIPTNSGEYPALGWGIVAACFALSAFFVYLSRNHAVQARVDAAGVYERRYGETVAWDDIESLVVLRLGIQRVARFKRNDGGKTIGINTTFYDRGVADLCAVVRSFRPDLIA